MSVDAYDILGVDDDVDDKQLRSAYRARARVMHPDVNADPGGQLRFAELANAYRLLTDPTTRSQIDAMRARRSRFESGRPAPAARTRPGTDVVTTLDGTGHALRQGDVHEVEVTLLVSCERCAGAGTDRPEAMAPCARCDGTGYRRHRQHTLEDDVLTWRGCPGCQATGLAPLRPCAGCSGNGQLRVPRIVGLRLASDSPHGSTLLIPGGGNSGHGGGPAGDLLVRVTGQP